MCNSNIGLSISFLKMNWPKIGMSMAPYLASVVLSVIIGIICFRRWIAPGIIEALEASTKTTQTLASLGGIKKADWNDVQKIEKAVTTDLLYDQMPELQALKLILSSSTWEQVEEMIEENPAAVMQMYEKWKPYLGGSKQTQEQYMF